MPYISPEKRKEGTWCPDLPGLPPMPPAWRVLADRPVVVPDQSRYGRATTDPLGRDGPGWYKGKHGLPVRAKSSDEDDQG